MISVFDFLPDFTQFAIIPALIGAGGALLGGLFGGLFQSGSQSSANKSNIAAVQEQNKGNMALAEYQYSKNLEQWNRQNEYNDPSAQMERYRRAGLNPNLAIGNAGNATSSPEYSAPTMQRATVNPVSHPLSGIATAIAPAIDAYQNMQMKQQELAMMHTRNEILESQRDYLGLKTRDLFSRYKFYNDSYDYRLNTLLSKSNESAWRSDYTKGSLLTQEMQQSILKYQLDNILPWQLRNLKALEGIRGSQSRIAETQANLWDAGINPSDPSWLRMIGVGMNGIITKLFNRLDKWTSKWLD